MGVSTDGQICYGIPFEEGYEFPWDNEKWGGDIADWWIYEICGYTDPFKLWNDDGEYEGGEKPPESEVEKWYSAKRTFLKNHPIPVEMVNYCSYDYEMYIIAVPSSFLSNSRGYPKQFLPLALTVKENEREGLINFCEKHCKPENDSGGSPEIEPSWYLTSLWG